MADSLLAPAVETAPGLEAEGVFRPCSPCSVLECLFGFSVGPNFPGVGLGANRGPPGREDVVPPSEVRAAGVTPPFGCLRTGDSGLGSDGLVRGLKSGLAARPGPTDWLNLGMNGVGGVYPGRGEEASASAAG